MTAFEPYTRAFAADPYPGYAALRESAPFHRDARLRMTFVSRYRDILAILTDRRFGRVPPPGRGPANARPALPFYDRYVRVNLLETEGATHRDLRRLLARALNPSRIATLGERVESIARDLVNRPEPGAEIDFVAELAEPLPVIMIAELLGWPEHERHRLRPWSADIVRLYEKDASAQDAARAETAAAEFATMIDALADERKAAPRADLVSELAAMEDEQDGLSREQLIASCMLVLNAGHEATVNAAGNGLLALLRHPRAQERLREDPGLIQSAVEEMLRYDPPLHLFHRFAGEEVMLAGHRVAAGETVGLLYGSANRDPEMFQAPDTFDIGRRPNRHLAFGAATHFCLGATLARLELKSLMGALLARRRRIELVEAQPEYRTGLVFRGLKRLMIRM
jgi:cytochrome P450